jgi:hypothetical protein
VAVTPIHLDLTGRSLLRRLKTWTWGLPTAEGAADGAGGDDPEEA